MLEQKIALQNMKISVLKSEIDGLEAKYNSNLQKFRFYAFVIRMVSMICRIMRSEF